MEGFLVFYICSKHEHMKSVNLVFLAISFVFLFTGCKKGKTPRLVFKFKFDHTQERLNNIGQPAAMAAGHAGQNPSFNTMSAHYIELAPGALTLLGGGEVLYRAEETIAGGSNAIDFEKSSFAGNNETFFEVPLKDVAPGDYEYLRVSLAYQNFDVNLYIDTTVSGINIQQEFPATVASFVGFNTYIKTYNVKNQNITVNDDRSQGYWGFESNMNFFGYQYNIITSGQAPAGATTVVNPIASTSPIPAGSCVVTGPFNGGKLHITGNEEEDIIITVSLSTNKSFEWVEVNVDGKWEPSKGEYIVDMGLRGMVPYVEY